MTREKKRFHLEHGIKTDLQAYFPVSGWFSLRKSCLPLVFSICSLLGFLSTAIFVGELDLIRTEQLLFAAVSAASVALTAVSILYWELYRRSLTLYLEGFRLSVSYGVFHRKTLSSGLRSFSVVSLRQSCVDALFGLSAVIVYGSNQVSDELITLPGLTACDANELFILLLTELNAQLSPLDPSFG